MEAFKQKLFLEEYKKPMEFEVAATEDLLMVEKYIATLFTLNKQEGLFSQLRNHLTKSKTVNDLDSKSGFTDVLYELGLIDQTDVLVIWNYPEEIDKFKLSYLINYWEDIWFSAGDDAVGLFFPNINKAVVVTHYKVIFYSAVARLQPSDDY